MKKAMLGSGRLPANPFCRRWQNGAPRLDHRHMTPVMATLLFWTLPALAGTVHVWVNRDRWPRKTRFMFIAFLLSLYTLGLQIW